MQILIETSSENTFESENTVDSQETISEDKMDTDFYTNETPRNIVHAASKEYPTTFLGKDESVETKSNLVVCESFEDVSDSDVFRSPAIFDS